MGALFSKPKAPPLPAALPEPLPPAPLVDPEDIQRRARNRRKVAEKLRSGRRSTILSEGGREERLG